jgi:hypothetical protein
MEPIRQPFSVPEPIHDMCTSSTDFIYLPGSFGRMSHSTTIQSTNDGVSCNRSLLFTASRFGEQGKADDAALGHCLPQ